MTIVSISQKCASPDCKMRVETALKPGMVVPDARECVFCQAARSKGE